MNIKTIKSGAVVVLAILLPVSAHAEQCQVVDPELQESYLGGCRKGLAHGRGQARGSAEYVGEFRNGLKHGRGVKTWPWGDRYEGDFLNDQKHGNGMYVWGVGSQWAGERYVGGFVADKRDGWGTYYWPNGDRFDGQWKEDLRYGYTAMEQRRQAALEARQKAYSEPGVPVCGETKVDIAQVASVRGVTARLEEAMLIIRLTSVSATSTGLLPAVQVGDVVRGSIWDWTPCS